MEKILISEVGDYLEKKVDLSGVYIGCLDYPDKECNIENDDDEEAHFDKEKPKLIKYIGSSQSHTFMMKKTLGLE